MSIREGKKSDDWVYTDCNCNPIKRRREEETNVTKHSAKRTLAQGHDVSVRARFLALKKASKNLVRISRKFHRKRTLNGCAIEFLQILSVFCGGGDSRWMAHKRYSPRNRAQDNAFQLYNNNTRIVRFCLLFSFFFFSSIYVSIAKELRNR